NKNVVIIDDMIDTAGTITIAANVIADLGAKSVRVMATHPVLSGSAYERIEKSAIEELVVTDSIPLTQTCSKIKVLTIADMFADVINKVYNYQSISSSFIF
ncbi:MAG: phosphoribosyltransferase family protein, partial [Bacteroidota bacterium]|nr:phosphoribosyltransferase family protein [Bacteroidota bacterium]